LKGCKNWIKRFEVAIGHVIAKLKSIDNSGLVAVSLSFCESILKNKKKAELIKAKMTGSSLEALLKQWVERFSKLDLTMENTML
jgi:peptidyl-prolyl cis-trans isomerase D